MTCFIKEEYYRFIFDNTMDAILLTTPDGRIHHANNAAWEMFQRTDEDFQKEGRAGVIDPEDPNLERMLRERMEKGFVTGELTFIRKDGSRFIGQFTSSLFNDENNETWTAIIIRDVTESKKLERKLKEANDKLKDLAYIDYLTGVLNRRALIDRLGQEMERSKREFKPLSLILLDIDSFKEINDTYGHLTGDQVLKAFARSIKESLRTYDILGRFGGDEFLICLPDTDFDSAIDIAERVRKNIAKIEVQKGDVLIKLSSSAGITYYDHNSIEDLDTLISKVDYIMYRSKEKKNSIYTSI